MKNNLLILLKSLGKTTAISIAFGTLGHYAGTSFWWVFSATFAIQFLLFYMLNEYLVYRAARDTRTFQIKEAEILARNTMRVQCASCKKETELVVSTNTDNRFICGFCNTKNAVYLTAETAVVTEPLYEVAPAAISTIHPNGLL